MKPRDIAGKAEEEEEGEPRRYSWGTQKKKKKVNPGDTAGDAEEKEEEEEW